ncbi:MAG: DUF1697 domain-containing protein [Actinomycetaceae bacterium]|nr:DUF1697 domain-containing protein [Actinomycetaceae bacterium]MDY5854571.1 DUF1697 domain-containing protein [Arcanobacterium sp.]
MGDGTNRYIALLRGVNISGKNVVPMAQLRIELGKRGFNDVTTYLHSGNVLFSSTEETSGDGELAQRIEEAIVDAFNLRVPVLVMPLSNLVDVMNHAPAWWGGNDPAIYDNLIFVFPPASPADVYREIGEPKAELEHIEPYRNTIFWSFSRKDYRKTNWWPKTASTPISKLLTIRTAKTIRKILSIDTHN